MWETIYLYNPLNSGEIGIIGAFIIIVLYLIIKYLIDKKHDIHSFIEKNGIVIICALILLIPVFDFTVGAYNEMKFVDLAKEGEVDKVIEGFGKIDRKYHFLEITIDGVLYEAYTGIYPVAIMDNPGTYRLFIINMHSNDTVVRVDVWDDDLMN